MRFYVDASESLLSRLLKAGLAFESILNISNLLMITSLLLFHIQVDLRSGPFCGAWIILAKTQLES